ncbi:phosphocholine-specific phospholipase C [Lapillicoccus jejuensis]|uniref:phospholipase C n=1 Tax=Lapillicoccus jejuensis TaxID=402171 RepID=A0A542DYG8_9MICO|nr:phospholipase C, phosphocholine-specific [Lapillicoccus jejuensis]TQJ08142.1 phospholipase C [Lapillicoccus jejuensis]
MTSIDRRRFLQLTGGAAALASFPALLEDSVARAASIAPDRRTGSIQDVEHVVVLMQENRSFDHYFGTLRGVRGYGDPHPVTLPSGKSVWHQPTGAGGEVLPYRPDVDDMGLAFLGDLDHGWEGGHDAFAAGRYDQWVPTKTSLTMTHMQRGDLPFQAALADAFTVCDAYHCSLLGPTDPNRYYLWTGWVGNDGRGGGPVIDNAEKGYDWSTYPERLEKAGVSWKVYQDVGDGLDASGSWGWTSDPYIGNYGDNSLLYFHRYQDAADGSPLAQKARTGTNAKAGEGFFDRLRADVAAGTLPSVSYVVAPEAFTEHPNWPANYGAWYVAQVLDALTSNPEVWSRTALFITYDENDGFFDHVVPPHPPTPVVPGRSTVSTANEVYVGPDGQTGGYGLGQRVPMLVVSPWSTGGWVCSETFDHTSVIRFLEKRFGVREPNLTPWRRAVCGDLTSAFDFTGTRTTVPTLPPTAGYAPPDRDRHPDYRPAPPTDQSVPSQEKGVRPSRPLGYDLRADLAVDGARLRATLRNEGTLGAHVQARAASPVDALLAAPRSYTVGAHDDLVADWPVGASYDVELHGPNGLYRSAAGTTARRTVEVAAVPRRSSDTLQLVLTSGAAAPVLVTLADRQAGTERTLRVRPGARVTTHVDTSATGGWYDVVLTVDADATWRRGLAGRVETGGARTSDPLLGA